MSGYADCTIPFDRIYGVMGLVDEDLRIAPDYGISETELLSRVLRKHAASCRNDSPELWGGFYVILEMWHSFVKEERDLIYQGLVKTLQDVHHVWRDLRVLVMTEQKARQILKELDIDLWKTPPP